MAVIDVSEAEFEQRVLDASTRVPVVVDFWAGWCQPCLVLGPVLEKLADEHDGRFILAKVDVDRNQALASAFGVQGIPAVKAFADGRVVDEFVGAQPEEVVRSWLEGILPSAAEPTVAEARAAEAGGDELRAEALYRSALETDPRHEAASVGLAGILFRRGEATDARRLLASFPANPEARRLLAEADLHEGAGDLDGLSAAVDAAPDDADAVLALATAEAAAGRYGDALERSLRLIAARGDGRDGARDLMVKVFETLGADHPLVREYRPRLASALY